MADLNVEPKSSRPWWLWLLLALIALAALLFLARGCNKEEEVRETEITTTDTTRTVTTTETDDDWTTLDRNLPAATYEEITDSDITVRGNEEYAIYSLDETILFDSDSKAIRPEAEKKLQQVAASLQKRFADGKVRIYSYTDAKGSAGYNQQLAEDRAESVRNWLVSNGKVNEASLSLHPVGESQPVASNATAAGRQQNRRVEIVVRQEKQ